jgi:hypothetical protein
MVSELPARYNDAKAASARPRLDGNRPMADAPMTESLPDRLSVNQKSPHYDGALLERDIGVRFNGEDRTNVEEYCVSEGWIRVPVGKTVDRKGDPLTIKLKGKVEPYFRSAD